jgi:hypothetical protein
LPNVPTMPQVREALGVTLAALELLPEPPVRITTLVHEAACGALVRLHSQTRASIVLSTTTGVGPAELDLVARSIVESMITIRWIGTDETRAARFRNDGVEAAERHWREMATKIGFDTRSHPAVEEYRRFRVVGPGADVPLPSLVDQAREADEISGGTFYSEAYHVAYRRLSSAMHGDSRVLLLQLQGPRASWAEMAMFETAVSAGGLLVGVAHALQLDSFTKVAQQLFSTIAPGFPRPK